MYVCMYVCTYLNYKLKYILVPGGFVVSRVATIGYHVIYKIVDTCMLKIFNQPSHGQNSVESKLANVVVIIATKYTLCVFCRYLRIFQNVDLSSNFYFRYMEKKLL